MLPKTSQDNNLERSPVSDGIERTQKQLQKTKRPKNKDNVSMRFIVRMDYKRTVGWWVRLYEKGNRKPVASRYFPDKKYESMEDALVMAKQWRDEQSMIHKLDFYLHVEAPESHFMDSRSKSGAAGVFLDFKEGSNGAMYVHWVAKIVIAKTIKIRSWSIRRHGYRNAWKQAMAYRSKVTVQPIVTKPPEPGERLLDWAKKYNVDLSH